MIDVPIPYVSKLCQHIYIEILNMQVVMTNKYLMEIPLKHITVNYF